MYVYQIITLLNMGDTPTVYFSFRPIDPLI